jgi:glyoxylase I family protein
LTLQSWARRLEELGVRFSPIAASLSMPGAAVIVFRDPDYLQLELFARPEQSGQYHRTRAPRSQP